MAAASPLAFSLGKADTQPPFPASRLERGAWEAVRKCAGVWLDAEMGLARFAGPDAAAWLQTQTTNDASALRSGAGQRSCALDRKGKLRAVFSLHAWEDEYWAIFDRARIPAWLEDLDARLFLEKVSLHDASAEVDHVLLQGPVSVRLLARAAGHVLSGPHDVLPRPEHAVKPLRLGPHEVLAFRENLCGADGFRLICAAGEGPALLRFLLDVGGALGVCEVPESVRETLRIEAGLPRYGVEIDENSRVTETPLARTALSLKKGCYIGQEVVAKQRAHASVRKAFMGVVFDAAIETPPPNGATLLRDDKKVGTLRSSAYSFQRAAWIGMAELAGAQALPEIRVEVEETAGGMRIGATLETLPFVVAASTEERARAAYEEAIDLFNGGGDESRAAELLDEALLLDPTLEDAAEALGVLLHRQGRTEEACAVMTALAELNPRCVMAHTNLSIFYAALGRIDDAEIEKARAATLQWEHARTTRQAEEAAVEERRRIEQEAQRRLAMFAEALTFDPDDLLANFGSGMALVQLQRPAEAIPFLQRAVEVDQNHSVAHLNLAKCLETVGRTGDAILVLRQGILAATRKGEFVPLREMERRLRRLADVLETAL